MDYLLAEAAVLGGIVASTIWWGRQGVLPMPACTPSALPEHVKRVRRTPLYDQDAER